MGFLKGLKKFLIEPEKIPMKVNNITKFKKSKIYVKDLGQILIDLNRCIEILSKHKKYIMLQDILALMADKKVTVQSHYEQQKKIFESKGLE